MKGITTENIGKKIKITEAKNKSLEGVQGEIIDESKNMLHLKTEKGIKKLIKKQIIFKNENKK
jgi:RNase P/RNase MRP subunit p29